MVVDIHPDAIAALVNGDHGAPFDVLGPQPAGDGQVSIRALQPAYESLTLVVDDTTGERRERSRYEMTRLRDEGLFVVDLPAIPANSGITTRDARIRVTRCRFTTPTLSPCASPITTFICSGRVACCKATTSSARTPAKSKASRESASRSGHPTPTASA